MNTDRLAQLLEKMSRDPELLSEFVALAARHGIDLEDDQLSEGDLDQVTGGTGEQEGLRLQLVMDRYSNAMSTLSNLMKKESDTASNIIQNLK